MAFDTARGLVYVGGNNYQIGSFNLSTDKLAQLYSAPGQVAGLAYDPVSQVVFAGMCCGSTQIEAINTSSAAKASVGVGSTTVALLDDPSTGRVYAANYNSANVSVIAARNETVVGTIAIGTAGSEPNALALDSSTGQLVVGESGAFSIAIVNVSSGATWKTVPVGNGPDGIAIDPFTNFAYVANYNSATVSVVNLSSGTRVTNINVPADPTSAVFDPQTGEIWIGSDGPSYANLTILQPRNDSVVSTFATGSPTALAYAPQFGEILCSDFGGGAVNVYNASNASQVAHVELGASASDVAVDPADNELFVTDSLGGIGVFDLTTWGFVGTLGPAIGWTACAYDARSNDLVAIDGANQLGIFNLSLNKLVGLIALGSFAYAVVIDTQQNDAFVSNAYSNNVSVVNLTTDTLNATVGVGQQPLGEAFDPQNDTVFIGDQTSNDVYVVSGANLSVVRTFSAGCNPTGLTYAPKTNLVYVSDQCSNRLSEFNATTYLPVRNVTVGSAPGKLVDDPLGESVLCEDSNSGNISIISYATGTVATSIPGGSLSNAIDDRSDTLFGVDVGDGLVSVLGVGQSQVDFEERGLPEGTAWSVRLPATSRGSESPIIPFLEQNGSYNWSITTIPGYQAAGSGTVVVDNSTRVVVITFTRATYPVAFVETGLPAGTAWSVTLGGSAQQSTGRAVQFLEPNGSLPYQIGGVPGWVAVPPNGFATVDGGPVNVSITWQPFTYAVGFTVVGLPSGLGWWVNLSGGTVGYSTAPVLSLSLPNGSYAYSVSPADKEYRTATGVLRVAGAPVSERVQLAPVNYSVDFSETGLIAGVSWWLNVSGGPSVTGTGTSLYLDEANGTYSFSVASADKEYSAPGGRFVVDGASTVVTVAFSPVLYPVTFTELGLPAGTGWRVQVGQLSSNGSGALSLPGLPNGSYAYQVTAPSGFIAVPASGTVEVHGNSTSVSITFERASSPALWGSSWLDVGIIAVAVAVGAAGIVLWMRRRRARTAPPVDLPPEAFAER